MPAVTCYYCEASLTASPCPACGETIDLDLARKLDAAWALEKEIAGREDLDADVGRKLLATLRVHLTALQGSVPPRRPPPVANTPAAMPVVAVAAPAPPRPPRTRRAHALWARLGPAFAENILLTLAVFLIVGGAVFFVTTAWTTMTGTHRLLVVFGGLQLFGALLFAAGRVLNRGGTLPDVQRTLTLVTGFLAPIAAVVAGLLLVNSWPIGALAAAVALASTHAVATSIARQHDAGLLPWLPRALLAFAGLGLAAPALATTLGWIAVGAAALLLATTRVARAAPWIGDALLGFAALAVVGGAALHAGGPPAVCIAPVGVVVAALGLVLARRTPSPARAIAALATAVSGCALATAEPRLLLVACALATVTALTAAFALQRPALLWPGLALSAITYFLLPAPVRELALSVRAWFAGSLGYAPERLPLSFYGITFLPYTAACALAAAHLRRRGRPAFASLVLGWTLTVAVGLALLSVIAGSDARAPAAVLGAEGATLAVLGWITQRQRLVFAGTLGVLGSLASLLVHRQADAGESILWLAGSGLLLVAVAAWLQRGRDAEHFHHRASHALLDAAGSAALVTTVAALSPLRLAALPDRAGAYVTLALLVALLARAYRQSWLGIVAWVLAGVGGLIAIGGNAAVRAPSTALGFGLASALPLLTAHLLRFRPRPTRPGLLTEQANSPGVVATAVLALQAFAAPAVLQAWSVGPMSWPVVVVFLVAGVIGNIAGARLPWLSALAAAQLVGAALAATKALGHELQGFSGAAGWAAGGLAVAGAAGVTQRLRCAAATPAWVFAAASAWLASCTCAVLRLHVGDAWPPPAEAVAFLLAMTAVLATSLLASFAAPADHRPLAAVQAALGQALLAVAVCDALRGAAPTYPLALIGAAVVARVASRGHGPVIAAADLGLALLLAIFVSARDLAGEGLLLLVFALIALVGRFALGPLPVVRSICVLIGALGSVWFALTTSPLAVAPRWLPAVVLGFAAAATFAPAAPRLGIEARGMRAIVLPIAVIALLVGALHAAIVLVVRETPFRDNAAAAAAAAFAALGLALGWREGRGRWPIAAAALASFVAPPLNSLWPPNAGSAPWPDVEVALLALLVAACKRTATAAFGYGLAGAALALTALELQHPSTPWTFAVATAVPLALAWRQPRRTHVEVFAHGLLATAWVTTLHLHGARPIEALPLLAALAGLLAALEFGLGRSLRVFAATASIAAVALMAIDVLVHAGASADATTLAAAMIALAEAAAASIGRAVREERSWPVHVAVAALLTGYAFGALRTHGLDAFAGHHPHVVLLACVGLLFVARRLRTSLSAPLVHAALAVPVPAIALVGHHPSFDGAFALLLGAVVYGHAALILRSAWLPWLAAALLNGALFSLWQHQGLVDPAFYGVPAGLTLVVGAELVRPRSTRLILWTTGLITLYGSITVQVFRTEEPLHALLLFAAGFATVMLGFARRRNDYILAGTATVIVDVVGYLARHGLERDFVGAGLLVAAGLTVLMAAVTAKRRRLRA